MKTETRTLDGPFDFELGQARSRPLSYVVSTPDQGDPKGLVFVIPGFGGDTAAGYGKALRGLNASLKHLFDRMLPDAGVQGEIYELYPTANEGADAAA